VAEPTADPKGLGVNGSAGAFSLTEGSYTVIARNRASAAALGDDEALWNPLREFLNVADYAYHLLAFAQTFKCVENNVEGFWIKRSEALIDEDGIEARGRGRSCQVTHAPGKREC
jgi:hypothetical protein